MHATCLTYPAFTPMARLDAASVLTAHMTKMLVWNVSLAAGKCDNRLFPLLSPYQERTEGGELKTLQSMRMSSPCTTAYSCRSLVRIRGARSDSEGDREERRERSARLMCYQSAVQIYFTREWGGDKLKTRVEVGNSLNTSAAAGSRTAVSKAGKAPDSPFHFHLKSLSIISWNKRTTLLKHLFTLNMKLLITAYDNLQPLRTNM